MRTAQQLPSIIYKSIFVYHYNGPTYLMSSWKKQLVMIQVCQNWRQQGYLMQYSALHIADKRRLFQIQQKTLAQQTNCDELCSNSSLLLGNKHHGIIKSIKADIIMATNLESFLGFLADLIIENPQTFSDTQKLHWHILKENIPQLSSKASKKFKRLLFIKADHLCKIISQYLPGINNIKINGDDNGPVYSRITSRLITRYSSQLKVLLCNRGIPFTIASFSVCLAKLHICLDTKTKQMLPRIFAKSLRHLRIDNASLDFSWKSWVHSSDNADIIFLNLTDLELTFDIECFSWKESSGSQWRASSSSSSCYRVKFPRLSRLCVQDELEKTDFSTTDEYPKVFELLSLENSTESAYRFSQIGIKSVAQLFLKYHALDRADEDRFYDTTNSFLNNVQIQESAGLIINNSYFGLNASKIQWTYLTDLSFYYTVELDLLVQILGKTPNIKSMIVYSFAVTKYDNYKENIDEDPILSNTLKKLVIAHLAETDNAGKAIEYIQQVLSRTVSLANFKTQITGAEKIQNFVQEHGNIYKHFGSLIVCQ